MGSAGLSTACARAHWPVSATSTPKPASRSRTWPRGRRLARARVRPSRIVEGDGPATARLEAEQHNTAPWTNPTYENVPRRTVTESTAHDGITRPLCAHGAGMGRRYGLKVVLTVGVKHDLRILSLRAWARVGNSVPWGTPFLAALTAALPCDWSRAQRASQCAQALRSANADGPARATNDGAWDPRRLGRSRAPTIRRSSHRPCRAHVCVRPPSPPGSPLLPLSVPLLPLSVPLLPLSVPLLPLSVPLLPLSVPLLPRPYGRPSAVPGRQPRNETYGLVRRSARLFFVQHFGNDRSPSRRRGGAASAVLQARKDRIGGA